MNNFNPADAAAFLQAMMSAAAGAQPSTAQETPEQAQAKAEERAQKIAAVEDAWRQCPQTTELVHGMHNMLDSFGCNYDELEPNELRVLLNVQFGFLRQAFGNARYNYFQKRSLAEYRDQQASRAETVSDVRQQFSGLTGLSSEQAREMANSLVGQANKYRCLYYACERTYEEYIRFVQMYLPEDDFSWAVPKDIGISEQDYIEWDAKNSAKREAEYKMRQSAEKQSAMLNFNAMDLPPREEPK